MVPTYRAQKIVLTKKKIVGGLSVINRAYPVYFLYSNLFCPKDEPIMKIPKFVDFVVLVSGFS